MTTSIATHSSPMLLTKGAIAIAHTNMFMPANKQDADQCYIGAVVANDVPHGKNGG